MWPVPLRPWQGRGFRWVGSEASYGFRDCDFDGGLCCYCVGVGVAEVKEGK